MNSSMIVTEPLAPDVWDEIGWQGCELLSDGAHVYVYLQRTADGRIAIGGRGVPYRFASRTDGRGETAAATVASLRAKLHAMFPATVGVELDHAWSGVLGVPRDWCVSVNADPSSGLAWAGGYVGEGVAAANLAGRTLRDLLLDQPSPLTTLPWVGRQPSAGSPSRCAGARSTPSTRSIVAPIASSSERSAHRGWGGSWTRRRDGCEPGAAPDAFAAHR